MKLLITLLCFAPLFAETVVQPGDVSGDWTQEGSPYLVNGQIRVQQGDSLRLHPGTRVVFQGYYSWIVSGVLECTGTETDSVILTCEAGEEETGWEGIRATNTVADTLRFYYAIVENVRRDDEVNAGIHLLGSIARLDHCRIQRVRGSGVLLDGMSKAVLTDCEFRDNGFTMSSGLGSAVLMRDNSSLSGSRCLFVNNYSHIDGGAIAAGNGCSLVLDSCRFEDNGCNLWGAAMDVNHARLRISRCLFVNNVAQRGAAAYLQNPDSTLFERCLFEGNQALEGSAVYVSTGTTNPVAFSHCDFVHNIGTDAGVIRADFGTSANSSIFYENTGTAIYFHGAGFGVEYCAFYPERFANFTGEVPAGLAELDRVNSNGDSVDAYGNLFLDPQFVDAPAGDFHLLESSPAIDAGDPASPQDPDGTVADIGMLYFEQEVSADPTPPEVVDRFKIYAAAPNPFNPATTIRFELHKNSFVQLLIYDLNGRSIVTLVDGPLSMGEHSVAWDASGQSSGTYFALLESGGFRSVQKLLYLK